MELRVGRGAWELGSESPVARIRQPEENFSHVIAVSPMTADNAIFRTMSQSAAVNP